MLGGCVSGGACGGWMRGTGHVLMGAGRAEWWSAWCGRGVEGSWGARVLGIAAERRQGGGGTPKRDT